MGPETASVTPSSIEISSRYFLTLLRYQAFQDVPQQAFVRYPIDQQKDITVTGFCDITMRHSFRTWPIFKRINILLFTTYFDDTSDAIKKSSH